MKKPLLIIGIILLAAALICFALSMWFHHMGGQIMDGSDSLYARIAARVELFLRLGIGVGAAGAVLLVLGLLLKTRA